MLVSSRKAEKEKLCTQHAFPATNPTLRYVFGARLQDATDNPAAHTLPDDDAGNVDGVELTRDAWSATAENWLWGGSALMRSLKDRISRSDTVSRNALRIEKYDTPC